MTRLLILAPLLLLAACAPPPILTTGQRATAEVAGQQTAIARGTCPGWDSCTEGY